MFVVRVEVVLKVEELKLWIVGLFRLNHDLHLTAMGADKLGRLLNQRIEFSALRLSEEIQKIYAATPLSGEENSQYMTQDNTL